MNKIYVDDRIETRHPEQNITKGDALTAWYDTIRSRPRLDKTQNEYLAIRIDVKGRLVKLVAIRNREEDFLIYHAFTSPQANAKRELGITGKSDKR